MKIQARLLGLQSYSLLLRDMRNFTQLRNNRTADEIWVVEHPPVFTRGQRESGSDGETIVVPGMGPVPVVASDRGGLITYHGPGQMIFYVMIDLKRSAVGVRRLVAALEQAVIDLLRGYGIEGRRIDGAPGVYVNNAKIASLGLRIRRGSTYHGLSLNVDMEMAPFGQIDPCGVPDQPMTQLRTLGVSDSFEQIADKVCRGLSERLGYTNYTEVRQARSEADSLDDGVNSNGGWPTIEKGADLNNPNVGADGHEGNEATFAIRGDRPAEIATPVGSNLLSHLTAVSETSADVDPLPSIDSTSDNDVDRSSMGRDQGRQRLSSVSASVASEGSDVKDPVEAVGASDTLDDRLHAPVATNEHRTEQTEAVFKPESAQTPAPTQRPKARPRIRDDSEEDLGFLAPSNLHELIKDSDHES